MDIPQSTVDVINFVAAIASLVLAVLAMALSLFFFWWSLKWARESSQAADKINESVAKLEDLYGRLYSDTFAALKETMADVRKHAWPDTSQAALEAKAEGDRIANKQLEDLKTDLTDQIRHVIETSTESGSMNAAQGADLHSIVNGAVERTRAAEESAKLDSIQSAAERFIEKYNNLTFDYPSLRLVLNDLGYWWGQADLRDALKRMLENGPLEFLPMQAGVEDELDKKIAISRRER